MIFTWREHNLATMKKQHLATLTFITIYKQSPTSREVLCKLID